MSGSSMNLQTLLPAKAGEAVQRGVSLRKSDQTFAAVFEKKIQMRQAQSTQSAVSSEERNRPVTGQERQDDTRPVEKSEKTDKAAKTNPAKEKLKELMKKAKATLDAMKDPEATPEQLKALAETLKSVLGEIKVLVEGMETQTPDSESALAENPELLQLIESMGQAKTNGVSAQATAENTDTDAAVPLNAGAVHKKEHWDNRQAPELKGNPMLKDLEKVIEAQADIIAEDPELKEALKQILTEIKAIQDIEVTKPDIQFSEKLEDLMSKLNGVVLKPSESKLPVSEKLATETPEEGAVISEETADPTKSVQPAMTAEPDSEAQTQEDSSADQNQAELTQGKQSYQAEVPVEAKGTDSSDKGGSAAAKSTEAPESISTAPKTAVQTPLQTVQNPQAFQDTLDAVKEGVQAKAQFQSRIMEQVVETVKMNVRADDGKSEMIMKLKPESLGNVALKVSIEKGIVLAEFQVDSQAVKQALESNLQDLRNALQDKGFNVFDLDVSVRKDNQQQQQNSGNSQGFRNRAPRLEGLAERMERRLMSLESAHRESTIDYLG